VRVRVRVRVCVCACTFVWWLIGVNWQHLWEGVWSVQWCSFQIVTKHVWLSRPLNKFGQRPHVTIDNLRSMWPLTIRDPCDHWHFEFHVTIDNSGYGHTVKPFFLSHLRHNEMFHIGPSTPKSLVTATVCHQNWLKQGVALKSNK
jgi:hypothetical protein